MPETGHAVTLSEWGETPMEAVSRFMRLEPQPKPEGLGPHDVLLRVRAAAVGWVDLIMASGQYQHAVQPPYTPGLEFAGEVAEVGAAVTRVKPGDAVLADGLLTGPRSSGAHQRQGGFATWAVLSEAAAMPLPAGLSYAQGSCLLGPYETATHVLIARGRVQPGERVLILGASGATGLAAVHVAKLLGAEVIAVGRGEEKLAGVKAHGADHTLSTADGIEGLGARIKALGGAHVVYDAVGGPISVEAIRGMRFGGRFCVVGWAGTPFVARGKGQRGAPDANLLPTNLIQMKGLDVLGCPAVIALAHDPGLRPARLRWILERVAEGRLRPHAGPVYALEDYAAALEAKWTSAHLGGCLVSDAPALAVGPELPATAPPRG